MRLDQAAVVLRPREPSEVLDLACRFGVAHARPYLRLAAAVLLPCAAICLALRYALDAPWWATWLAALALATPAQGVFSVLASRLLFSEAPSTWATLRAFGRRLPSYLGSLVVKLVALGGAGMMLLVPLPFAWIALLFQHEASLLEQVGPIASAQRSARLVRNRAGFAMLMLLLVAQGAIVLGAELFGQGLVDSVLQLGRPFGSLFEAGGTPYAILGLFASAPFIATARFLQYIDLRTRSDGWDVQVRFLAIAEREKAAGELSEAPAQRGRAA